MEIRNELVIGILRENSGKGENRVALTPSDVKWLVKKGIKVEVESSKSRIFKDEQYEKAGARVLDRFKEASLLVGIKPPSVNNIYKEKIYMIFSHTIKGQPENMPLLKGFLRKGVTLIDYEKMTDLEGNRLVYFGRFAGICGLIDSLHYLGKKLEWEGIKNPFLIIKPSYKYNSCRDIVKAMTLLNENIRRYGFASRISPFIIGITGHGNVSQGVQEILEYLQPVEVHPRDLGKFVYQSKKYKKKIYKIVFLREERFRSKDGHKFYFEEYLKHPERFESDMERYLPYLNMLILASYWDSCYPRMITKRMVNKLFRRKIFRLKFIGDISCDIDGCIELTYKTTTRDNPVFTYNPERKKFTDGCEDQGITVLAIDNLPSELPRDSSEDFSKQIRDYVYQIATHGVKDITRHAALPREIREAVITQNKKLTKNFTHLKKYLV